VRSAVECLATDQRGRQGEVCQQKQLTMALSVWQEEHKRLQGLLPMDARPSLLAGDRRWMAQRDQECRAPVPSIPTAEWIASVSQSMSDCLIAQYQDRTAQLLAQRRRLERKQLRVLSRPAPATMFTKPTRERYFVARTRDLLQLLHRYPAIDNEPFWYVAGIDMYPVPSISARGLRVLRDEASPFDRMARDRALRCGTPTDLPAKYQVVVLDLDGADVMPVPVFLSPESNHLRYVEVALFRPRLPLVLLVHGYVGVALRVATSPGTELVAVHLQTYHPSVVLGVPPVKVSQTYRPPGDVEGAASTGCAYRATKVDDLVESLGLHPIETEFLRLPRNEYRLFEAPFPITRGEPRLGAFLDMDMPAPSEYGLAVLSDKRYLRQVSLVQKVDNVVDVLEILKPFRLPGGMYGSHARTFYLPRGKRSPDGNAGHSSLIREP